LRVFTKFASTKLDENFLNCKKLAASYELQANGLWPDA
jgi:hypothetical protein